MIDKTRHLHIFNLVRTFDQQFSDPCPGYTMKPSLASSSSLAQPPTQPLVTLCLLSQFDLQRVSTCLHLATTQHTGYDHSYLLTNMVMVIVGFPRSWHSYAHPLCAQLGFTLPTEAWNTRRAAPPSAGPECFHTALEIHPFWS